jgi:hypothetical protein
LKKKIMILIKNSASFCDSWRVAVLLSYSAISLIAPLVFADPSKANQNQHVTFPDLLSGEADRRMQEFHEDIERANRDQQDFTRRQNQAAIQQDITGQNIGLDGIDLRFNRSIWGYHLGASLREVDEMLNGMGYQMSPRAMFISPGQLSNFTASWQLIGLNTRRVENVLRNANNDYEVPWLVESGTPNWVRAHFHNGHLMAIWPSLGQGRPLVNDLIKNYRIIDYTLCNTGYLLDVDGKPCLVLVSGGPVIIHADLLRQAAGAKGDTMSFINE